MRSNGNVAQADISVCGPLARGAEDLEIAMDVMAGPDEIDGRGWTLTLPRSKKKKLREFKVAVVLSDPNCEVDQSVQDELQKLADLPRQAEGQGERHARPAIDTAEQNDVYVRLLRAATSARLTDEAWTEAARDCRRPARCGHELLRPDAARQLAVASRLAAAQREAAIACGSPGTTSSRTTTCCSARSR
jgi:amidase